jgi:hypothetical protein
MGFMVRVPAIALPLAVARLSGWTSISFRICTSSSRMYRMRACNTNHASFGALKQPRSTRRPQFYTRLSPKCRKQILRLQQEAFLLVIKGTRQMRYIESQGEKRKTRELGISTRLHIAYRIEIAVDPFRRRAVIHFFRVGFVHFRPAAWQWSGLETEQLQTKFAHK